jgi:hypothetical protein
LGAYLSPLAPLVQNDIKYKFDEGDRMTAEIILGFVTTGFVVIAPLAIFVALDESSYHKKAIICIIGGTVMGATFLALLGTFICLTLPVPPGYLSQSLMWKSILIGGGLGGGVGTGVGLLGGAMTFGLSVLIRYVFLRTVWLRERLTKGEK